MSLADKEVVVSKDTWIALGFPNIEGSEGYIKTSYVREHVKELKEKCLGENRLSYITKERFERLVKEVFGFKEEQK